MTTGKTIALTRQTFVGKISVLFNMLSVFVLAFLPGGKASFNFMAAVTNCSEQMNNLEPRKIKSATVSPSICHEVIGPDAMVLVF